MPEKEVNQKTIEELLPSKSATIKQEQIIIPEKPKIPIQKKPNPTSPVVQKKSTKKIFYKYIGKDSLIQLLRDITPKQLVPTKRMSTILGLIFLGVVGLALFQFPFEKLLSGDVNIVTGIGYPWPFLELGIMNPGETPLFIKNLFLDLAIYVLLAYIIDVCINLILDTSLAKSKEELKKQPKTYRRFNQTFADKITKKLFQRSPSKA